MYLRRLEGFKGGEKTGRVGNAGHAAPTRQHGKGTGKLWLLAIAGGGGRRACKKMYRKVFLIAEERAKGFR